MMSFITRPIDAAKTAVNAPTKATTVIASAECSKTGKNLATRKTPAATMVAAWIRALTGVGPSIASGSQVCSGNWPDLPAAPAKMPRASQVKTAPPSMAPAAASGRAASHMSGIWKAFSPAAAKLSAWVNRYRMAIRNPTSPMRVMMNAFLAAAAAAGRSCQKPINK